MPVGWNPGPRLHSHDGGLIVVEIWESREAQGAELPRLGAAIQKLGLQGVPMRTKWASKLLAHPPDKAS